MAETIAEPELTPGPRLYILALMTLVYFFYLLDRNAIVVTQEAIKVEFGLSDTQIGLVTGILYGGAYALVGLPIGWAIQRAHRVHLLSWLVGLWSATTLFCGLATQFWQLAVARMVVGGAESGGAPVALSILHPMFPGGQRATVSSIFFAGAGLGVVVSFLAGGYIATEYGWRAVFLIYGGPGILLALLIYLTVPETQRPLAAVPAKRSSMWADLKILGSNKDLQRLYAGAVLFSACNAGIGVWMVSFLMRVHQLPLSQAAATVSLALGVCGTIGSLAIGFCADRLEVMRRGSLLMLMIAAALMNGFAGVAAALASSTTVAIAFFCLWGLTALVYSGPTIAAISEAAPQRLGGLSFSLFAILCNFVGSGLGPLAGGAISDFFHDQMGADSIRPSLVAISLLQLLAAGAYYLAYRRRVSH